MQPTTRRSRRRTIPTEDAYLLSATRDLGDAASLAHRHLHLVAEGRADQSTERAFQRAMIVTYASPWSSAPNDATQVVFDLVDELDEVERTLHERICHLRHNDAAHTNRKLTNPGIHVEQGALPMFTRHRRVLANNDVLGVIAIADKLGAAAFNALIERHPDVITGGSHSSVSVLPPVVSDDHAQEILASMASGESPSMIADLFQHGWRDCEWVSLAEAAVRLRMANDQLSAYEDADLRRQDDFPEPSPLVLPEHDGPRWRMSWIRRWSHPLHRLGT